MLKLVDTMNMRALELPEDLRSAFRPTGRSPCSRARAGSLMTGSCRFEGYVRTRRAQVQVSGGVSIVGYGRRLLALIDHSY